MFTIHNDFQKVATHIYSIKDVISQEIIDSRRLENIHEAGICIKMKVQKNVFIKMW